jgi:uncharacterized spore protein YtfJ
MSAESHIKTTVEELLKVLATENVIGEPIEMDDKTLIPVTKIGMGFGAGTGEGKGEKGEGGKGGGAGGGAGVEPIALVVILKGVKGPEGIKVLSLSAPNPIAKAISEITPAILDKLNEKKTATKADDEKKTATKAKK